MKVDEPAAVIHSTSFRRATTRLEQFHSQTSIPLVLSEDTRDHPRLCRESIGVDNGCIWKSYLMHFLGNASREP